ncbi:MAG: hypothetical protein VX617_07815 [Pseudomonadota bacterium]|nr:hypothetical protein [Pseudomonadota bacterium]
MGNESYSFNIFNGRIIVLAGYPDNGDSPKTTSAPQAALRVEEALARLEAELEKKKYFNKNNDELNQQLSSATQKLSNLEDKNLLISERLTSVIKGLKRVLEED